ncbi:phosphatidylglycerophosphatase A family protein [Rhodovibrio salinarum]|uniref:Phosphatidylglycerophosphatase A n=1 Tax=Rhodovibrio salinarum TaxID=1087 RepID=A0A934QIZ2_9PROT|nr:phosphatidylglycerophosphatase A [Rhodovibrio salinarum]MBK1697851.1 phosphatidylglycerophosphatase A [Rhodovibrio salinarum]
MAAPASDRPGRWSPLALFVTFAGAGYLPKMPGTWGSLAALPPGALILWLGGGWVLAIAGLLAILAGTAAAHVYYQKVGGSDPQEIVIDEVGGQWLALAPLALDPLHFLVAFAAFRLFDTLKPWPINALERLPGGLGIMADDAAAGLVAAALSASGLYLTGQF